MRSALDAMHRCEPVTRGQAQCLTNDSLRAAYWQAKRQWEHLRTDWQSVAVTTDELVARGLRP